MTNFRLYFMIVPPVVINKKIFIHMDKRTSHIEIHFIRGKKELFESLAKTEENFYCSKCEIKYLEHAN